MNSLYIGVGLAIILALVTALIGPIFVDWGTHRAVFEAEASRIVGLPVKVLGDVDARLLPSPRVRFGDVVIGDLGHPIARVGRFELDLDVAGLIRGETRVSDLLLDRPSLDLDVDERGRLVGLPTNGADLSEVRVETARFVDGRVRLTDRRSAATGVIEKLEGRGTVETLAGAYRLEARGTVEGRTATVRLASRTTSEGPRLRFSADLGEAGVEASGDVAIAVEDGRPNVQGTVTLAAAATAARPAFGATGRLGLDADHASLADLAVRLGAEDCGVRLDGTAEFVFGASPGLDLRLSAHRLDLDGRGGADAGGARLRFAAGREMLGHLLGEGILPRRTRARIDVDTATLGGGLVEEISAEVATRAGGLAIDRVSARLPGDTRVDLSGRLDVADETLRGMGRLTSAAPEALTAWWSGTPAGRSAIGEIAVGGAFEIGRGGFVGSDLDLTMAGGGAGAGAVARGRVELRADGLVRLGLSADRLDGHRLAALARRLEGVMMAGRGLDLDLDVREMTLGDLSARGTRISLHADDTALVIDRLGLAEFAGAQVSASGRIEDPLRAPKGRIEGHLASDRPGPAVRALLELIAPGAAQTGELVATAAGPLDLNFSLEGRRGGQEGTGALVLGVTGRAAGGDFGLDLSWEGRFDDPAAGRFEGRTSTTGARLSEGAARLLGAEAKDAPTLSGSVVGRLAEGVAVEFGLGLGDRRLTASGEIRADATGRPVARLTTRVATADAGRLAALFGRPVAVLEGRVPLDLSGRVEGWGGSWTVTSLTGRVAECRIEASGTLDLGGGSPRVGGRLDLSEADLATLTDMALAAPADFDLSVTAARLDIDDTHTATAVAAHVGGRGGRATVEAISARLGGASIGGAVRAAREAGALVLSGRLTGARDAVSVTDAAGRPVLGGRLVGEIAFEAKGSDGAALLGSASGSGRVRLEEGRLSGFDPRRLAAPREGTVSAEEVLAAMAGAMAPIEAVDVGILLDKGIARVPHLAATLPEAAASGRLTADLKTGRLDGLVTLEPNGEAAAAHLTAVSRAAPTLDLKISGTLAEPRASRETSAFAAFLTLHRVEREIEAAEVRRQDRIERLRFSTLLKRLEERRRAREAPITAPPQPPPTLTGPSAPMPLAPAPSSSPTLTVPGAVPGGGAPTMGDGRFQPTP